MGKKTSSSVGLSGLNPFTLQFTVEDTIRSITLTVQQDGQQVDLTGAHKDGSEAVNAKGKRDAKVTVVVTKDGQTVDYPGEAWGAVWTQQGAKKGQAASSFWLLSSTVKPEKMSPGQLVFTITRTDTPDGDSWESTVNVPPGTWGPSYMDGTKLANISAGNQPYEKYRSGLSKTRKTSEATGTSPNSKDLDRASLLQIFPLVNGDLKAWQAKKSAGTLGADDLDMDKVVDQLVASLNNAFRLMLVDTYQARGAYLANAFVESSQCRYMTETQSAVKGKNRAYETDPARVQPDVKYLDTAKTGRDPNGLQVTGYQKGGQVNPLDNGWQNSFLGRGPIQVTNRTNYLQTIAVLEQRLTELTDAADQKLLTDALVAIKGAPMQAANPDYCFLFSAAYMKIFKGDEKATGGDLFSWMGAQPRKGEKQTAYNDIIKVLK